MGTKLTLKINSSTIHRAKRYAKAKRTSISKMVENYLDKVTIGKSDNEKITPLVKSLSGIISLPKDYDHKKSYADFLINKYK